MSVEAPLSYGQLYSFREVESYPKDWKKEANLPATWDLRGFTLERVEAALRRLADWHEPLRTSYTIGEGVPAQRIHDGIAPPVERVDRMITDYGDPDRTTTALLELPFPMTGELCWRGVLVTTDGVPMFLSLSFSHLIVDVWSIMELTAQFQILLRDPDSAEVAARMGPSPQELAVRQRGEHTRQAAAERYWRRVLTDDLTLRLPTLPVGAQRNRIQATLHSHRLGGLAAQAAKLHGGTAPAVLMGLLAAALSEHTGVDRVAISLMSSNRFSPEHQHTVGTMNQLIPVVSTVDHRATVAEHVTRLHWAGAKAYRHSCYDVDRIAVLADEVGATKEHDGWFNQLFPCWFNYLQLDGQAGDPADETPAELAWTPVARQYGQPFDVRVTVRGGRTSLALRTDPDVIPAEVLTGMLRSVALGTWRAVAEPHSSLKDLWSARAADLPAELYPR